jgi:hypothetical protein
MARNREHHHHGFPRPIARFIQLEGGQYGSVDMRALTPHRLEFQLGVDFVVFTHKQAEDLRDAVQLFIDLGVERHAPRREEAIVEEEEEVVEVVEERPRRRKRSA